MYDAAMGDDPFLRLERTWRGGRSMRSVWFPDGTGVAGGLGHETDAVAYRWDGLARGGQPQEPKLLIQVTRAGAGQLTTAAGTVPVGPGEALAAPIPAPHVYGLPPGGSWWFAWVLLRHPWAVERACRSLAEAGDRAGVVLTAQRTTPALVHLLTALAGGRLQDPLSWEEHVVALVLALARDLQGAPATDPLVALVDRHLAAHPQASPGVAALARLAGLSRGQFTLRFRHATGTTPARYVMQQRLEAARRDVEANDEPLAAIARRHGFVDERHLRRVFLRHYHVRPSDCRRA